MDEGQALLRLELARMGIGLVESSRRAGPRGRPALAPPATLMAGVVRGITMVALAAESLGRQRHALRMIAGRGADDAPLERLARQAAILL